MRKTLLAVLLFLFAAGAILAGCGGNGASSGSGGPSSANSSGSQASGNQSSGGGSGGLQVVKIASQFPLSGPISNLGDAFTTGAQMAIDDNKEKFAKLGVDLQFFPQDDQADPKIGVSNAEALVSDPQVLAMVGHYNSGVTRAAAPKYEAGNLPVVSPGNTAVDLTESGWKTYHRICARDDAQGPAGAKFAAEELGVKSVFVVHDKTAYGEGLATAFKQSAEELGIKVLGFEGQESTQTDFSALVNKILPLKPDAIYFGGLYNQTALLLKQAAEKGFKGYFMSGDGSDDPNFLQIAGKEFAKNAYITSVAGDASKTEEGKKWIERYKQKFGKDPNTFAVYGYDATLVILDALERAMNANGGKVPTRQQLNEEISKTKDFKGVFSTVTFDGKGDNVAAEVFVYSFRNGAYPAEFIKSVSK